MPPEDPGSWSTWLQAMGPPGLALFAMTNAVVGQPPSWAVFGVVGWLTLKGSMSLPLAVGAWAVGYTAGSSVLFGALRRYGRGWLDRVLARLGRDPEMFDRAERWFRRWGAWAVLVARVVPGFGWMITVPAGLSGMRWWPFALATLLGSAAWALGMTVASRELGDQYEQHMAAVGQWWYMALAVLGVVALGIWAIRRRKRGCSQ